MLLVQRNPEQRFMGGAWVFPGGATHDEDADHAATAMRELEEEAGIALVDVDALVLFSRWITPARGEGPLRHLVLRGRGARRRRAARGRQPSAWTPAGSGPPDALDAGERDELMLVFPTIKHLERLATSARWPTRSRTPRAASVEPVEPRVVARDGLRPRAAAGRARLRRGLAPPVPIG